MESITMATSKNFFEVKYFFKHQIVKFSNVDKKICVTVFFTPEGYSNGLTIKFLFLVVF